MHPQAFPMGWRLAALAAFWALPFLTGALSVGELRRGLPSGPAGAGK
jgi:hypothetical protein